MGDEIAQWVEASGVLDLVQQDSDKGVVAQPTRELHVDFDHRAEEASGRTVMFGVGDAEDSWCPI